MEDFSNYLTDTPPDMQSQSPNQQQHSQSSMQSQMAMHQQQQHALMQQMQQQQQQHHHHMQQQQAQQAQMQQSQQSGPTQQQLPSGPFAYPPPTAQSTPSAVGSSHLTPRSFAEAMGIDSNVFSTELSFQLPSFLTGPTVAPGGGGDVIPGSASNLGRSDSYSEAWYSGPPNSGSDMNLRATGDYPGFSPYGIQSSQDDQYCHDRQGMNSTGFSNQDEAFASFTPGEMSLQSSQDVQPQLAQSSNTPTYTPPEPFQTPQIPRAITQSPPQNAPIGPLPAATGTVMPGLYSTSGFDMLGVLARVASRPNPKIVLGPVDLTCSFVVVDVKRYDHPIVYASPTFHRLTGYEQSELIGRNCRFLQAPNGKVERGSTRTYTDNAAVAHFKKSLSADKECQASLINYRKNGQPFINLVSIIPITWDSDDIRYHVGFQVDLVDQPHAILQTMRDGSYIVNYSLQSHPQPALSPGRDRLGALNPELRQIIANTMSTGGFSGGEEHERQDLNMMLLENSDDFIHVLSLKGSFLYVSPSVRHILEYEPEELIGKSISDVTHPSDIVPVMRELKESSTVVQGSGPGTVPVQKTVDLLLRVRRKTSGYVWIESQGRLHVEPGKGRKAIILSGRKKEVPRLQWSSIARAGGLGDKEFWVQMSVDGLILVASSGVQEIMGYTTDEFVGTNLIVDHFLEEWKPSILARLAAAISPTRAIAFASEAARHPDVNFDPTSPEIARCVMITRQGQQVTADLCFYPPLASMDDGTPGATSVMKIRPASLVCQVKIVSPDSAAARPHSQTLGSLSGTNVASSDYRQSGVTDQLQGHIVHDLSSNVFEELETTRSTSWQYELQQLKISNKRMKDEVDSLVERLSNDGSTERTRRRRTRDTMESE
ncbi:hypothetical protein ACGC1H_001554 [Rhizoctonia solani]|uniref:PAS domain-containing protein n=1 Tax=Rhizoctonia solani TaxID=456999 RepID=A0A8H2XPE1_9AGAM|nr:unnamed protein product [Rhizoctonia solani]